MLRAERWQKFSKLYFLHDGHLDDALLVLKCSLYISLVIEVIEFCDNEVIDKEEVIMNIKMERRGRRIRKFV